MFHCCVEALLFDDDEAMFVFDRLEEPRVMVPPQNWEFQDDGWKMKVSGLMGHGGGYDRDGNLDVF